MPWQAKRYHDISCGHRVYQHESKCAHLHGHNYRVHFTCEAEELDNIGRVIDFSDMKSRLCMWLEDNWDHKTLIWENDPWAKVLPEIDPTIVIGNRTIAVQYVEVVEQPRWEFFSDNVLRKVGRYRLGLPYVPAA